jgi:chromosome segregation ATPase
MAAEQYTLDALRAQLTDGKKKEATEERELKDLKDSNKSLESGIAVIEQIAAEYRGKLLTFQNDLNKHACLQKDTLARVTAKLGDTKPVDQLIADYDKAIADLQKKVDEQLEPAVAAARTEHATAEAAEKGKKDAYEALKNRAKNLDAAFKALEDIRKGFDGYEKEEEFEKAYFLLTEHKAQLDWIGTLSDPAKFEADLIKAQAEIAAASEQARKKKNALDDAVAKRDEAKKELEQKRAERRKAILAEIDETL